MRNVMRTSRKLWHPVRINKLILLVAAGSLTSSHFDNFRQSHVCYEHVEFLKFPKNAQSDVLKDLIHLNCCLVLQMSWSCWSLLSQGSLQPTCFKRKGKCRKLFCLAKFSFGTGFKRIYWNLGEFNLIQWIQSNSVEFNVIKWNPSNFNVILVIHSLCFV